MATTSKSQRHTPAQNAMRPPKSQVEPRAQAQVFDAIGVVPDWDASMELVNVGFGQKCDQLIRLKAVQKETEQLIKELNVELEAALCVAGLEKVMYGNRPVQVVKSHSAARVLPEKLLMKGVPADVIAECTEPGKPYSYVLVGKAKE